MNRAIIAKELIRVSRLLLGAFPTSYYPINDGSVLFVARKWPKYLVIPLGNGKYRFWEFNSQKQAESKMDKASQPLFLDAAESMSGLRFDRESLKTLSGIPNERQEIIRRTVDWGGEVVVRGDVRRGGGRNWAPTEAQKQILIKSSNEYTHIGLYDYLVGKLRMVPSGFAEIFGVPDITQSERISVLKHGKWEMHVDESATFSEDDIHKLLDTIEGFLGRKGMGRLAYGNMMLVSTLQSQASATYDPSNDFMRMRTKGFRGNRTEVRDFLHELGHRNWYKFLPKEKQVEVRTKYMMIRRNNPTPRELGIEVGDTIVEAFSGDKWVVYRVEFDGVGAEQVFVGSPRRKNRIGKKYKLMAVGLASDSYFLEGKPKNEVEWSAYFPTSYSSTSDTEWYAELFADWLLGSLKEPAQSWFEGLH